MQKLRKDWITGKNRKRKNKNNNQVGGHEAPLLGYYGIEIKTDDMKNGRKS